MWNQVNIMFKLKSPLHIGYMPFKGSVISPTRYYVPGRNLWGSITKRITEYFCRKKGRKTRGENYKKIGVQIMENFRISYFYVYDGRTIYFPKYEEDGLKYGDIDGKEKKEITESEFEYKFINGLISTEIDKDSKTAKDKSLHEIVFINDKIKLENGNSKKVKIVGCLWIKENAKIENKEIVWDNQGIFLDRNKDFNIIDSLTLGGESKYGFGHVLFDSILNVKFPIEVVENRNELYVKIKKERPLLGHLQYDKGIRFVGDIELLSGRGYLDPKTIKSDEYNKSLSHKSGAVISKPEYYFSPGTKILTDDQKYILIWDGTIKLNSNNKQFF